MRKLATIRTISELLPIDGADLILLAKIDGWQCVVKASEFAVGDLCVYFEIDSLIPLSPAVEHLRARAFKKMGDKEGIRVKTIKLRGQLSQGLALPIHSFAGVPLSIDEYDYTFENVMWNVNEDVSDYLGVLKYEQPIPVQLAGQVRGNFPTFIKKTDEERCQNLGKVIFEENKDSFYEVTMKMDGTSFTGYSKDEHTGVCGRNWELDINEQNANNSLVRMYVDSGLQAALCNLRLNYAVQGELMGPGIQQNREGFKTTKLFVFNIYDIDNSCYLPPAKRREVLEELYVFGLNKEMVQHVPIIAYNANLYDTLGITNTDQLLKFAEGPSLVNPVREGLVFKRQDGGFSFKAISNAFLLKEKD
jgi:RNA ligase (TIGR02306 family)